MKKLRRLRKFIVGAMSVFLIGIVALSLVSKFVYHRSLMATCSEIFLRVVDRNSMYCDEVKCSANIAEKTVTNLQDTKPTKKMKVSVETTHEHGMQIFYINKEAENNGVLFYLHGGAYLNEPASQHWGFWEKLALEADIEIIVPIYFKCTNYTCQQAYDAMLEFYLDTVEKYEGKKIYIGGDSSGGGFALGLSQLLRDYDTVQPSEMILICPWVDLTMSNPDIEKYYRMDAMLGNLCCSDVIVERWRGDKEVTDPMVSPTFGTFNDLCPVTIFIGTREVLYPDTIVLYEKMSDAGADVTLHVKEGMSHVYPLFPVPEATEAIGIMAEIIK